MAASWQGQAPIPPQPPAQASAQASAQPQPPQPPQPPAASQCSGQWTSRDSLAFSPRRPATKRVIVPVSADTPAGRRTAGAKPRESREARGELRGEVGQGEPAVESASPDWMRKIPMQERAIKGWLNQTLKIAAKESAGNHIASIGEALANKAPGLNIYGLDTPALNGLGLDAEHVDRVHRAMFVYSQGLHATIQEATSRCGNSAEASFLIWRGFVAVLEHAGGNEQQGGESLLGMIQRTNREDKIVMIQEHNEQNKRCETQRQQMAEELRELKQVLQGAIANETSMMNERKTLILSQGAATSKLEREVALHMSLELRLQDTMQMRDALLQDLGKERAQCLNMQVLLAQATETKDSLQVDLDGARVQLRSLEAEVDTNKVTVLEMAQQRQRLEQQVRDYKSMLERLEAKIAELKEQLEQESDSAKRLTEQNESYHRELRKLKDQLADKTVANADLQTDRDSFKSKLERLEKRTADSTEEQAELRKNITDLGNARSHLAIDLKNEVDRSHRAGQDNERLQESLSALKEEHRNLEAEANQMRDDVSHLGSTLSREQNLRKSLQANNKDLSQWLRATKAERDTHKLALEGTQKEYNELVEKSVLLERIIQNTKTGMRQQTLEFEMEGRAYDSRAKMLEECINDERKQRRIMVDEVKAAAKRQDDVMIQMQNQLHESLELKRRLFEKEEQLDRFKLLLSAQEQRNSEQLVTLDKHRATVASHDAEVRQAHILLNAEREESDRQLREMETVHAVARREFEGTIERWKMGYEEMLSRMNFNPLAARVHQLVAKAAQLEAQLAQSREGTSESEAMAETLRSGIVGRDARIAELERNGAEAHDNAEANNRQMDKFSQRFERKGMALCECEIRCDLSRQVEAAIKGRVSELEKSLEQADAKLGLMRLTAVKPTREAAVNTVLLTEVAAVQTDLSFQYLEYARGHDGRRPQIRNVMPEGSRLVDDPYERRDFHEGVQPGCLSVHAPDFEENAAVVQRTSVAPVGPAASPRRSPRIGGNGPRSSTVHRRETAKEVSQAAQASGGSWSATSASATQGTTAQGTPKYTTWGSSSLDATKSSWIRHGSV